MWEKKILVAFLFRSPVMKLPFLFPLPIVRFFKLLLNLHFVLSSFLLCTTEIQGKKHAKARNRHAVKTV